MAGAAARFDDLEWRAFFGQFKKGFDWASLLKVAMNTAGIADIVDHFKNEESPDGKWQHRAYQTEYRYAKIFDGDWKLPRGASRAQFNPSNKVLHHTNRLRGSILPANVKKLNATSIMVFSNVDYSGIHDNGGPFKAFGKYSATMPKREFMWLSDKAQSRIAEIVMNLAIK